MKMTAKHLFALSFGFAALIFLGTVARAETPVQCASHADVVTRLEEAYGETRQSTGLGANNALFELFASDTTGTWTITMTMAGGLTCLMASGDNFQTMAPSLPARGSPA
ncbi:MAG: hypothetical protein WBA91_06005 [Paracoccaceae bacterium]